MKEKRFKKQIVRVETMGLIIYCETKIGQYKKECEEINCYDYSVYESSLKNKDKWGWRKLSESEASGVTYVANLPHYQDKQSIVNFCSSLALATVAEVIKNNISAPMVGRLAGVIYANLESEEVETKEE